MSKIVIFRTHLPEHLVYAKRFVERGDKVLIHTNQVTEEVAALSKNPQIQSRFGSTENLTQMADLVIE